MRWGVIATAVAGLVGVAAAHDAGEKQERLKWNISGAKLVTAKKGDAAPSVLEEYVVLSLSPPV